jgi:hypothetical protein
VLFRDLDALFAELPFGYVPYFRDTDDTDEVPIDTVVQNAFLYLAVYQKQSLLYLEMVVVAVSKATPFAQATNLRELLRQFLIAEE